MRTSYRLLGLAVCSLTACDPWDVPIGAPPDGPVESFLEVTDGTHLAVLDWGGTGLALILLSGAARTAHVYEGVAPYFADERTVIGVTRRGERC